MDDGARTDDDPRVPGIALLDDAAARPAGPDTSARGRNRLGRWFSRHKALGVLTALALALALVTGVWLVHLNSQISAISRFDLDLDRDGRPARVAGPSVNLLLLGVDDLDYSADEGPELKELVEGTWQPGAFRSDTMLLVHLDAAADTAQVVSIPRDSWVDVPGHGKNKINAALSLGGPPLAARTVEDTFGVHLDHVMLIDFEGLRGVTDALGGVDVHLPATVSDPKNDKVWTLGTHHLDGDDALLYVRQRYGLPGGDFDRIQRQQNYLRAVLDELVRAGTLLNPITMTRLTGNLAGFVAVDSSLTNGALRSLALSARGLRPRGVRFLTVPHDGSVFVGEASVVRLRLSEARDMFTAISEDGFEGWYADHDVTLLPAPDAVH